jgi:hypothetical protein
VAENTGRKEIALRLYRKNTIEQAKAELLSILAAHPEGMRTSELSGTKQFHAARTLRNAQITKLLRSMPDQVQESWGDQRNRAVLWWQVKAWSR